MTIAILVPTKGRPDQCKRMVESVRATSKQAEVWLGIGAEDLNVYKCEADYGILFPDLLPTVHKWNTLAEHALNTGAKLFMLGADDTVFSTPCWDEALLEHYNNLENKIHVYHLQDSRDQFGTPHPIFTREWIEFFGYMLLPMYLHWEADTAAVKIAKANNCFTHMRDFLLTHIKPSDKGICDATHNDIRSRGWRERDAHVAKTCAHFVDFESERLSKVMK